jgi:membrane protease YdiL (CAAX protease family)
VPSAETPPSAEPPAARRARPNAFGLPEAAVGIVAGFLLASLAAGAYLDAIGKPRATHSLGAVLLSLAGLWTGLVAAALVASRHLSRDYGLLLRPWPDLVLGPVIGVASQLALVPLLELPLLPFVHNLSQEVGKPAQELTSGVHGAGLVVLALFVCVGSPLVEELFFRGLLLRSLLGVGGRLGRTLGPVLSIAVTSLLFALAHFEAIQFLGLAGFGAVLGYLAWRTGRLGPGIVAHASFNAVAIVAIALQR